MSGFAMRVAVRVDATVEMGIGHVMRCLSLADHLKRRGAAVHFVCRELPASLLMSLHDSSHEVHLLPRPSGEQTRSGLDTSLDLPVHSHWLSTSWQGDAQDTLDVLSKLDGVEWLVVDHYALDWRWETWQRRCAENIMVIDDLADRVHHCDVLLDQNLNSDAKRYVERVPTACKMLLGPTYALLRPEFIEQARLTRARSGAIQKIFVFFGGSDHRHVTLMALQAIQSCEFVNASVDVVVGASNPRRAEIEAFCRDHPQFTYHCQVTNIAELMRSADLALGAGGASTWERCVMGLPSIVIAVADNQIAISEAAHDAGLLFYCGFVDKIDECRIAAAIQEFNDAPDMLRTMSERAMNLIDANGCRRVADQLERRR